MRELIELVDRAESKPEEGRVGPAFNDIVYNISKRAMAVSCIEQELLNESEKDVLSRAKNIVRDYLESPKFVGATL